MIINETEISPSDINEEDITVENDVLRKRSNDKNDDKNDNKDNDNSDNDNIKDQFDIKGNDGVKAIKINVHIDNSYDNNLAIDDDKNDPNDDSKDDIVVEIRKTGIECLTYFYMFICLYLCL
jgi:hypothetical protein